MRAKECRQPLGTEEDNKREMGSSLNIQQKPGKLIWASDLQNLEIKSFCVGMALYLLRQKQEMFQLCLSL